LKLESPALENPKVENLNWTVQSEFSTFGFSNAGLSNFEEDLARVHFAGYFFNTAFAFLNHGRSRRLR